MTVTGNPTININVTGIADYIIALLGFGSGTPGTMPVWVTNQQLGDSYVRQVATPAPLTIHTESAEFAVGKTLTVNSSFIVNGAETHNNIETHFGECAFNSKVDLGDLTSINVNSVNAYSKVRFYGELIDSGGLGSPGGAGQILSSTVTGVEWIDGLPSGIEYRGTWDANANTSVDGPLASGVGTQGYYYIVDVPGTTNLDGFNSWQIGDWCIFSSANTWQEIDNSGIFSGSGTPNTMTKWTGPSALGDSQTTDDGTNITMTAAGNLSLTGTALDINAGGGGITSLAPHTFNSIVNLTSQTTITGAVTDAFVSSGTVGQVLSSTGASQVQWIDVSAGAGALAGSGTLNQIAKWTPSGAALGDSSMSDDGVTVAISPGTETNITSNVNLTGGANVVGTVASVNNYFGLNYFKGNVRMDAELRDAGGSPGLLDQVLTSTGAGIAWKNAVEDKNVTVGIDAAGLATLSSTPVVVVARQGVGTVIEILSVAYNYDYATTVYDFTDFLVVCPSGFLGNSDTYQSVFKQSFINGVGDILQGNEQGQNTYAGKLLQDNTDMVITTAGLNPTTGDGKLTLNIRYRVLDIATWAPVA